MTEPTEDMAKRPIQAYQGHTGKVETDADYEARDQFKITLRLSSKTIAGLGELAKARTAEAGETVSRQAVVTELVAAALERQAKRRR